MKEMCKLRKSYKCKYCRNDMLFFTQRNSTQRIDYKNLYDMCESSVDLRNHLANIKVSKLKCPICEQEYIIDWSHGYPQPINDKLINSKFSRKGN